MDVKSRIILLDSGVDEGSANNVIMQLLYLNSLDENKPIYLYINSPGGDIVAGLAIYDTIKYIKAPVHTVVVGLAASMGAFLLTCGVKRSALVHSKILIHQPRISLKQVTGMKQSEIEKTNISIIEMRETLETIMANNIGVPVEQIHKDSENDNWMSAKEAKEYGLINEIVEKL